jgi:hypothetical protein
VHFQRLDVRFPLRAAEGPMTKDWLLNGPKREEAGGGSRTRLPLHPTGSLAGRLAPCLARDGSRGWPVGPELAGLGNGSLLRRAVELAPSELDQSLASRASRWSRRALQRPWLSLRGRCAALFELLCGAFEALGMHCALNARPNVRAKLPAEACSVSLVCEGAEGAAYEAYAACRSGSA